MNLIALVFTLHLDSGYSRHMTGNRSFFTNFTEFNGGNVTFGDGNVASVKEKDNLCSWNP